MNAIQSFIQAAQSKASSSRKPVLLFVPYAGGSACSFPAVRAALADELDVMGVSYPGRTLAADGAWAGGFDEMVDCVVQSTRACGGREVALWGHSLGAIVAMEASHRLMAQGSRQIRCVIASASRPPHLFRVQLPDVVSDQDTMKAMVSLGGMPSQIMVNPRRTARWLPMLKADLEAGRRYRFVARMPLPMPITVLSGCEDPLAPQDEMAEWGRHTSAAFDHHALKGGHFFVHGQERLTARLIRDAVFTSVSEEIEAEHIAVCQPANIDSVALEANVS
jgi:pyochelin biosynthetic protein PchC